MLELLDDQSIKILHASVFTKKSSASLRLVASNSSSFQEIPTSQTTESNRYIHPFFTVEVRVKGPCLYEMRLQDPSHYLSCNLILEVERSKEEYGGGTVVCHFLTLSVEELNDFVEKDETLYGVLKLQFQMKILEQVLLFCATHYASMLVIFADGAHVDALGIYQDFLNYKDQMLTQKREKAEIVIPTDRETFNAWADFMEKITIGLCQTLWRNQRSSPIIRQYLKNNSFGANAIKGV